MTGKTHMALGVSITLLIMKPITPVELIVGSGIALTGSIISDIDISSSMPRKKMEKIFNVSFILCTIMFILNYLLKLHLINRILHSSSLIIPIIGVIGFFILSGIGMHTSHRTFTHSILALVLYSLCILMIIPKYTLYFSIGMVTHILVDLLNKKKVHLLYPTDILNICFKICPANGEGNKFIYNASLGLLLIDILSFLLRIQTSIM